MTVGAPVIGMVGDAPGVTIVAKSHAAAAAASFFIISPPGVSGTLFSALPNSAAVWKRAAGSFCRQRIAMPSISGEICALGFFTDGSTGVSLMCLIRIIGVDG